MKKGIVNIRELETDASVIVSALKQLSPRQQAVIGLRIMGYTQQAITALLGISRTTVWSDETAAVGKLKNILRPDID